MGVFRLFLALTVVVAHSSPIFGLRLVGGETAVQAFFVISGFYMSLILHEKYPAGWQGTKLFYSNRFLRIYPVYWASLSAAVVVSLAELFRPDVFHSLSVIENFRTYWPQLSWFARAFLVASNITVAGLDLGYFLRIDHSHFTTVFSYWAYQPRAYSFAFLPQAWSLSLEIAVYVIAPFLFRQSIWVLLAVFFISLVSKCCFIQSFHADFDPWQGRFVLFELSLFLSGAIGYRALKALKFLKSKVLGAIGLVVVIGIAFSYQKVEAGFALPGFAPNKLLFLSAVAIFVPSLFSLTKSSKIDRFIGELSYPVYLNHLIVIPMLNGSFGPANIYPILWTVVSSAIMVFLIDIPLNHYRQLRVARSGALPIQHADKRDNLQSGDPPTNSVSIA